MLKTLFGSRARIKLLKKFLLHPEKEFFVRELSRDTDEQINGVRRELDNLKKLGLVKSKSKNRKKFFMANIEHIFYPDLRNILLKSLFTDNDLTDSIKELGKVSLILLSGVFTDNKVSNVDLLVVGDIPKETFEEFIDLLSDGNNHIRYSLLSQENFEYRVNYQDTFVVSLLKDPKNKITYNLLKKITKNLD